MSVVKGRGFVKCGHFTDNGEEGSSDADVRIFGEKNLGFFEIYCMSTQTRGEEVSQCGHFADKWGGQGVNFFRFCANVLYGRPLT